MSTYKKLDGKVIVYSSLVRIRGRKKDLIRSLLIIGFLGSL